MSRTTKKDYGTTAKRIDPTCRNHGSCTWCESNRLFSRNKAKYNAQDLYDEWDKPCQLDEYEIDYQIELGKCLDHESEQNVLDFQVDCVEIDIEQWELDEEDSVSVDLMIMMLEIIEHAKKEEEKDE